MHNTKRTEIDQEGLARLEAAAQAEGDFFRDYASEPTLEELAAVMLAEAEDEAHIALQAELYAYAGMGMTLDQAAWMATLDYAAVVN